MLNDDYTPMEFVVHVLQRFFNMGNERATEVMLYASPWRGRCGVFIYEIAETKANQVMDLAREQQHPLQCTIEKTARMGATGLRAPYFNRLGQEKRFHVISNLEQTCIGPLFRRQTSSRVRHLGTPCWPRPRTRTRLLS